MVNDYDKAIRALADYDVPRSKMIDELTKVQASLNYLPTPIPVEILDTLAECKELQSRAWPKVGNPTSLCYDFIREFLPHNPIIYVDVGAADPVDNSNTAPFYAAGGHGLLIEPTFSFWYALMIQRPRDHLWPTAVSDYTGHARMTIDGTISSMDRDWPSHTKKRHVVDVETMDNILAKFPEIKASCEYLSIDVEGSERAVLRGIPFGGFSPKVVTVESREYDRDYPSPHDRRPEWGKILEDNGYVFTKQIDVDSVFVRSDLAPIWDRIKPKASCDDAAEQQGEGQ